MAVGALLLIAVACAPEEPPPPSPQKPPAAPSAPARPIAASSEDAAALGAVARRLAGLETGDDPIWQTHAEAMTELWTELETRHLEPMRGWAEAEIETGEAPLFYPFGGPDLVSARQLFPNAKSYVLIGLEPPGPIPELDNIDDATLETLRGGLANLVESGYFVTTRMARDFASPGLMPVFFLFLARAGQEPVAVQYFELGPAGALRPLETATTATATAVRVDFRGGGDPEPRTLYYLARDLSNSGLAAEPGLLPFVRSLGAPRFYTKSASYLLHMPEFSELKDFLLAEVQSVLQDDSGIPIRDLPPETWERRLYGTYTETLPSYREWFQQDLRALYASRDNVGPLPFAVGYNRQIGGGCLIWAERR